MTTVSVEDVVRFLRRRDCPLAALELYLELLDEGTECTALKEFVEERCGSGGVSAAPTRPQTPQKTKSAASITFSSDSDSQVKKVKVL